MFKIGKLFHLTHVVSDLAAVDKWYDDVFGVTRFYRGYEKMAGRDASLIAIGEVIMEPMMPARVANLLNPSVEKFHDRFGQHFHSIAWYVDDVAEISTQLDQHGLRLFNISGKTVEPGEEKFVFSSLSCKRRLKAVVCEFRNRYRQFESTSHQPVSR